MIKIEIRGHQFNLLPQKAIFWKSRKTLLISDLHLGKVMHFRKAGIAVPAMALINNFRRLDELILSNDAARIILLGDLFHNAYNEEWEFFAEWRKKYHSVEVLMVLGNHDIIPYRLYQDIQVGVEDFFEEEGFLFTHHPPEYDENMYFVFSGHIHPVINLTSGIGHTMKLPCFIFDENQAILPSFGVFTGGYAMRPKKGRRIYVIAEQEVIKV